MRFSASWCILMSQCRISLGTNTSGLVCVHCHAEKPPLRTFQKLLSCSVMWWETSPLWHRRDVLSWHPSPMEATEAQWQQGWDRKEENKAVFPKQLDLVTHFLIWALFWGKWPHSWRLSASRHHLPYLLKYKTSRPLQQCSHAPPTCECAHGSDTILLRVQLRMCSDASRHGQVRIQFLMEVFYTSFLRQNLPQQKR